MIRFALLVIILTSPVLLRSEKEERSEHPEGQIREESECREIDVEFLVACADGKNLEYGEDADAKNIDRPHVEVMAFIDLAQLADLLSVEILLTGAMPEHILDMEWIAVGCFEDLPSIELGIDNVQSIVLEKVVDELDGNALRQGFEFNLGEGSPDSLEGEILLHLNHRSTDEGDVQKSFQELLLSGRDPVQVVKEDQIGLLRLGDSLENQQLEFVAAKA